MQLHQTIRLKRKSLLSCLIQAIFFLAFICPFTAHSQEAGCFDADTLYVKINTIPQPINASPANFTNCTGSYTYQWQISTDDKYFTDIPGATGEDFNYNQPVTSTLFFLRKSTCGGITKYTNSIVIYPVYTACADFGLSLSGTTGNALATIKAGSITTTTNSTIGEFVIEWYRNVIDNTPEFVSGSAGATDPAVTVSHPFSGEPAEGGTWYPVIKYVYIDGVKYSRNYMSGTRHSPDLLHCLDPIIVIVNNLSCSNGGTVYDGGTPYSHLVSYRNTVNSPTLATRSFSFDLDSANKYFAWNFVGFQVADNIKITYVSPLNNTETVLEYWKVGSSAGPLNINTSPKTTFYQNEAKITPLTAFTFAEGDYLKIEIVPNGANSNTDWDFYCRCVQSPTCEVPTGAVRNITPGSVSMTYDAANCVYEVQYVLTNPYTGTTSSDLLKYHLYSGWSSSAYPGTVVGSERSNIIKLQLQKRTEGSYRPISSYNVGSCSAMSGSAQVSKSGNQVTLVFSNSADYNSYKNNYTNALSDANFSNYSSDPASINYYKFWIIDVSVANSCGDAMSRYQIWSHRSNPINFNDASLTITATISSISTNGYVPSNSCDFIGQITAYMAGQNNIYTGNNLDFSGTTSVKGGIGGYYAIPITKDQTDLRFKSWYAIPSADICNLGSQGWHSSTSGVLYQWELVYVNDRVVITSSNDPIHNFRLERWMDASGNELTSNPIVIYEIVNGVVTVNTGFPN